ncbi:hypothetical protein [Nonomuraea sp. NPDC050310]|uniref:hypothetical protein n=1 Tax=unclassified Nonomuraea TaxID=2593643 RepID=UPI0033E6EADD
MRRILLILAALQVAAVIVQFYLATFGAFHRPQPAPLTGPMVPHFVNGVIVIPVLALLLALVAALAKAGGRQIGLALAPLGVVVGQLFVLFPLAELVSETPGSFSLGTDVVLGFHAILGLLLLWSVLAQLRDARRLARQVTA